MQRSPLQRPLLLQLPSTHSRPYPHKRTLRHGIDRLLDIPLVPFVIGSSGRLAYFGDVAGDGSRCGGGVLLFLFRGYCGGVPDRLRIRVIASILVRIDRTGVRILDRPGTAAADRLAKRPLQILKRCIAPDYVRGPLDGIGSNELNTVQRGGSRVPVGRCRVIAVGKIVCCV